MSLLPNTESKANPTTSSQQNKDPLYDLLSQEDTPAGFAPSRGLCFCKSALLGQLHQSRSFTTAERASLLYDPPGSPFESPSLGRPVTSHFRQKHCLTNSLFPQIPSWKKGEKKKKKSAVKSHSSSGKSISLYVSTLYGL